MQDKVDIQRKKIQAGNPTIDLSNSCRIGNGIVALNETERNRAKDIFRARKSHLESCFFVPASGSGSRMFSELYAYLNDADNSKAKCNASYFVKAVKKMALFKTISVEWQKKLEAPEVDIETFIAYLLSETGLDLGSKPKGLIPFHKYPEGICTPFEEHLMQGQQIGTSTSTFHFTINMEFEEEIRSKLNFLNKNGGVEFSEQDPETNSVAFSKNLDPFLNKNGDFTMRPAGHGALIHNLNQVDADVVFIRNIDNIQHRSKAQISLDTREALAGLLLQFQDDLFHVYEKVEGGEAFEASVKQLNEQYDLRLGRSQLGTRARILEALHKPIRLCGMVKNEGVVGGGPFWVRQGDSECRQIIEKSQISNDPEQLKLMATATHFNPVEIICGLRDVRGCKYNLRDFVNTHQYFIVQKTQDGREIRYVEEPGLWNGAMAKWLTLFYEIDSACFSPVKTVMDLVGPLHKS